MYILYIQYVQKTLSSVVIFYRKIDLFQAMPWLPYAPLSLNRFTEQPVAGKQEFESTQLRPVLVSSKLTNHIPKTLEYPYVPP